MLVVADDALKPFLAVAIRSLAREMQRAGREPPPEALRLAHELMPEAGAAPVRADLGLLDLRSAAHRLGVSPRTLERRVAEGEVATVKIGGRRLFAPADLDDLVSRNRTGAA